KGVYYGGVLGSRVFKVVMSYILQSRNIPPTPKTDEEYALSYKEYMRKITAKTPSDDETSKVKQEKVKQEKKRPGQKDNEKVDARG
ncbi:MAG: hypothetical protein ACO39F_04010, partial [Candidatus Nanopelagicaceae bacterium]